MLEIKIKQSFVWNYFNLFEVGYLVKVIFYLFILMWFFLSFQIFSYV